MIPTLNDAADRDARSWRSGCSNILGRTCRCTSRRFIPISSCGISRARPRKRCMRARAIALETGLHYVYEGNIYSDGAHTSCPSCKTLLIRRSWHDVEQNRSEERLLPELRPRNSGPLDESARPNARKEVSTRKRSRGCRAVRPFESVANRVSPQMPST